LCNQSRTLQWFVLVKAVWRIPVRMSYRHFSQAWRENLWLWWVYTVVMGDILDKNVLLGWSVIASWNCKSPTPNKSYRLPCCRKPSPHNKCYWYQRWWQYFFAKQQSNYRHKKIRCSECMFLIMLGTKSIIIQRVRARFCKYQKSCDIFKIFNFFVFYPNKPFGELFSKIQLKYPNAL